MSGLPGSRMSSVRPPEKCSPTHEKVASILNQFPETRLEVIKVSESPASTEGAPGSQASTSEPAPTEPPRRRWRSSSKVALLLLLLFAAAVRLIRLGEPEALVFDETYYAKDACIYLELGQQRCGLNQ